MSAIIYKEWLPDLPELGNPGLLTANNVEPRFGTYSCFSPLNSGGNVLPGGAPNGVGVAIVGEAPWFYAANNLGIYMSVAGATFNSRSSTILAVQTNFLQFEDLMIAATGHSIPLLAHTAASATNFSTLSGLSGNAPLAVYVGRINQFVVAANTSVSPFLLKWSGIDDATSWPTANSATAIAQQSGEQMMDVQYGELTGIANGDQFGIVFQKSCITRVAYVGPPVVFQFDKISDKIGCEFPRSIVQIAGMTYFATRAGIHVTDGVTVQNISDGKCSIFWSLRNVSNTEYVFAAYNRFKRLIYWSYNDTGIVPSGATKLLIYSLEDGRFTTADYSASAVLYGTNGTELVFGAVRGFGSSNTLSSMVATAGSAVLTTGEMEINEAGRTYVDGVKPNVESSTTAAPAVTVRVGYRDSLSVSPTYTSTTSPLSRTGVANFRVDAKYHRFETQIVGDFDKATGIEVDAQPSSHA